VGAFLATPVIGTLRILGQYVYFKLAEVDTPPASSEATRPPLENLATGAEGAEAEDEVDAQS